MNFNFSGLGFEKIILRVNKNIDEKKLFKKLNEFKLSYEISILFFEDNLLFNMFEKNVYKKIKYYLKKKNNFFIIFSKK